MAVLVRRTKPLLSSSLLYLTWWRPGFRTISSGRFAFAPLSEPISQPTVAGTKVLETFIEEFEIGSRLITFETGKIARFANGAVVMGMEETKVLSTVASAKGDVVRDFLPLTVDYQEKQFAQGLIPSTFMRREGAPKERELLCGRIIDRPIRPLFPSGFYHEVQVMASVLSSDGKQDPDVMAANATSTALMISDIPWAGPIGVIRIGRICGKFIINPSMDELNLSDLNLIYACTRDKTLMIDVQAREISEKDLEAAMRLAHSEAVKYLEPQIRLAARAGKSKREYKLSMLTDRTLEKVRGLARASIADVFTDPTYGKFERGEALENITQDVKKSLEEEGDEESLKVLAKAVDTVRKEVVRRRVITEGFRVDGRRLDEVRPLYCESGNLSMLHGSSLFNRGDTQVLCTVTLGSPGDAQQLDSLVGPSSKRFMLHYSFPPYSINEVGKRVGLNRREVGHGTLAEKAVLAVLPPEEDLVYTIRINSEVMASDGSTSMATVCGASMALMDAGIPLREHVAGVSVGLVTDVDSSSGTINDYRILTDILGLEDHLGDMDFKIAGTRNGVTAIQLDIKPAGIPLDIICESLEPALKGRLQILDRMEQEINVPRTQESRNSPRLATLKFSNDALRRLIGPMGAVKRKIEEGTGARLSVSDGMLTIVAKNPSIMEKVQEKVEFIIGSEIEVGRVYKGVVTTLKEYGAFVEFNGGQQGLLHISELSHEPVSRVSDVVSVGQPISLMCIGQDVHGNIKLSLKATLPKPKSDLNSVAGVTSSPMKKAPNISLSVAGTSGHESQDASTKELPGEKSTVNSVSSSTSFTPAILIRTAAECDEEEKSTVSNPKSDKATKRKSKSKKSKATRKAAESPEDKSVVSKNNSKIAAKPIATSKLKSDGELFDSILPHSDLHATTDGEKSKCLQKKRHTERNATNDSKTVADSEINEKNLKIGAEVTATIHQVRARGLVLDLGGGILGMLWYESNGKKDFGIGGKLRVVCSSFTAKGIPVLSFV